MAETDKSVVLLTYGSHYSEGNLTGAPGGDAADKKLVKKDNT